MQAGKLDDFKKLDMRRLEKKLGEKIKIIRILSFSPCSIVLLVVQKGDDLPYVLKTTFLVGKTSELVEEFKTLELFRQSNYIITPLKDQNVETISENCFLKLPFYESDLFERIIENKKSLSDSAKREVAWNILCAICTMHKERIAHNDIAAENILVNKTNEPVLIDFGMATRNSPISCAFGRTTYMSPEKYCVFRHNQQNKNRRYFFDAQAADMWAFGVLVFVMYTKSFLYKEPVYSKKKEKNLFIILEYGAEGIEFILSRWETPDVSGELCNLLSLLLCNVDERATAIELKRHPFFGKLTQSSPKKQ